MAPYSRVVFYEIRQAPSRESWSIIGSAIVFRAIAGAASLRENEPTRRAATRGNRMQSVGVIRQLTRYPVKSMQGEAPPSAALTFKVSRGPTLCVRSGDSRSSFPWLTARELPELLYTEPPFEKAGTPEVAVTVATAMERIGPLRATTSAKCLRQDRGGRSFAA